MLHKVRWTPQKIASRLALIEPWVYRKRQPIPALRYKALPGPEDAPPVGADVNDGDWEIIPSNTYWGTWNTDFIMRSTFEVPSGWDGPVALFLPLGDAHHFSHPETLGYLDGTPYCAVDRHHQEIMLPDAMRDDKTHRLALHGWTGRADGKADLTKLFMRECAVVQIDQPTRDLVAATRVTLQVAAELGDNDPVKGLLYNALEAAFVALDTRDPLGTDAFYNSVPAALRALKEGVLTSGDPMNVSVVGVGHAHIDVAWLWTLAEVVRKSGRTFSTVLRLMEQFPEYKFSQSQAQLYQYVERTYPELFEQIKQRVAEGRWEPMGGTWVEPDCNVIGAESLARQFMLGRGYFRKHFGDVDTGVMWLPDTFGYSWALPQLIKQAGMKYFITHKMSWNQYNQMPNQILWWQGLDGTKVLTHFLTTPSDWELLPHATTYNAVVSPEEIFGTWRNFRQKETYNELITAFGYGDGGGGPTREMLENIDQMHNHAGAPKVRSGTIREFMEGLEAVGDTLPTWNGEFYLEYHRGTYTSQARNKRFNRKSEFLMHDAEFLAALAALTTDYQYPYEDVKEAWELICLNQFHDILPGSSIGAVYEDSTRDYACIREWGEKIQGGALDAIASTLPANTTVIAANTIAFGGRRVGLLNSTLDSGTHLVDGNGTALASQQVTEGTLVEFTNLQPYSVIGLSESNGLATVPAGTLKASQAGGQTVLENDLLRVEIGADGDITRIYDKQFDREVLAQGEVGNALLAFEDRSVEFDAWDIDIFYEDRTEKVGGVSSITITETGPLRATVEIERTYRSSSIRQKISLTRDSKRLDFDTWIDWHEHHTLLKAAFPVDVLSPVATFDVQWGNVERATHRNTSWDWARFETCAHKWADLSEGNYGVALLNDCKYGYDVHNNVMRLTLLKSATYPDPNADQGEHTFIYSLLPHVGDWRAEVIPAAYDLNDPLILRRVSDVRVSGGKGGAASGSLVSVSASNAVIETIKQAENGKGIIVRLYEDHRNRGKVTLKANFPLAEAHVTNLLEEDEKPLTVSDDAVQLDITPYQIVTLRLVPQA